MVPEPGTKPGAICPYAFAKPLRTSASAAESHTGVSVTAAVLPCTGALPEKEGAMTGNILCAPPEGLHVLARGVGAEAGVEVRRLEGVPAAQRHAAPRLGPHHQQLRQQEMTLLRRPGCAKLVA